MAARVRRGTQRIKRQALSLLGVRPEQMSDYVAESTSGEPFAVPVGPALAATQTMIPGAAHWFAQREVVRLPESVLDPLVGLVYLPDRTLFAESTSWPALRAAADWPLRPRAGSRRLEDGPYVFLGSGSFFHWITDEVPAFLAAIDQEPAATIIVSSEVGRNRTDLLREFGNRHVESTFPVRVSDLVLSTRGDDAGWLHPADFERLRRHFAASIRPESGRRLYVSRRHSRRPLANEDVVEVWAAESGFEVVYAEQLALRQQVELFSQASVVVGPHGAGLAAALWMPSGGRLGEIRDGLRPVRCFESLAVVASIRHASVTVQRDRDGAPTVTRGEFQSLLDQLDA